MSTKGGAQGTTFKTKLLSRFSLPTPPDWSLLCSLFSAAEVAQGTEVLNNTDDKKCTQWAPTMALDSHTTFLPSPDSSGQAVSATPGKGTGSEG